MTVDRKDAADRAAMGAAREAIGKLIGDDAEARRGRAEQDFAARDRAAEKNDKEA